MKNTEIKIGTVHVISHYSTHLSQWMTPSEYLLPLSIEKLGVLADQFTRYSMSKTPAFAESTFGGGYAVPLDQKNYYDRTAYFARCHLLNPDLTPQTRQSGEVMELLVPCRSIDLTHEDYLAAEERQNNFDAQRKALVSLRKAKADTLIEQIKTAHADSITNIAYDRERFQITITIK